MFDVWEFYANWRLQIGFFVFEINKFFFQTFQKQNAKFVRNNKPQTWQQSSD